MSTPLGIPYAMQEIDMINGAAVLVEICPVCSERIPVPADATGEATANPYGEHYQREHAPCRYEAVPDDPAIRVCLTHDPDLGLYGDETCSRGR